MSEAEWKTRKERIDKWLKSLPQPWEIVRYKDGLKNDNIQRMQSGGDEGGDGKTGKPMPAHGTEKFICTAFFGMYFDPAAWLDHL